jgi:hypothetical protein
MRCGRTFRSGRTRPADGQSNNSETLSRIQSLADYTIDTLESSFQKRHRHPMHLPVPFSAQHGAGPEFCGALTHAYGTLSGLLGRPRAIEQAYCLGIQVT